MLNLSNYSRYTVGENAITIQIVCNDGVIRSVTTEQYIEGFAAFLVKDGSKVTNNKCYKTSQKARNAAAKW